MALKVFDILESFIVFLETYVSLFINSREIIFIFIYFLHTAICIKFLYRILK